MTQKEELRKKFLETCCYKEMESESVRYPSEVFDFFYSEIEAREKRIKQWEDAINIMGVHTKTVDMAETILNQNVKISHLQDTLEAADEIMDLLKLRDAQNGTLLPFRQEQLIVAREKYTQLKTKSQS